MGVRAPIIREGDNLEEIVVTSIAEALNEARIEPHDGDIVAITESVVARAQGNYVTVDQIADETRRLFGEDAEITILNPIYSRNRFAICLRGIARAAKAITLVMPEYDEVGNPGSVTHPYTNMVYFDYYRLLCAQEGAQVTVLEEATGDVLKGNILIASIHRRHDMYCHLDKTDCNVHTLEDYFPKKCEYGLLGSNKADEERIKLFPNVRKARQLVYRIQERLDHCLGANVEVLVNGDGAFKSPYYKGISIWELADPVVSPAYTAGLEGMPNELKLKYLADSEFNGLNGQELEDKIKERIANKTRAGLIGDMSNEGCTPRFKNTLLGSCADLLTGSGDKGCPIVYFHDYEKNYSQD